MKAVQFITLAALFQTLFANPKDYIPAAPPYDKPVASYTVADVVGCAFATRELLPHGHPFKAKGGEKTIKQQWPGATTATNIDVILAYVANAQAPHEERSVGKRLSWCIREMTDVAKADQAAAFARTYSAQADPVDKRKIALMAEWLFPNIGKSTVLTPLVTMLDDTSVYETLRNEEQGVANTTVRRKAKTIFLKLIFDSDLLSIDLPEGEAIMSSADKDSIFNVEVSEADSCSRLKAWITTNWATIESQCEKIEAAISLTSP